jgi:hypothetical protein
MAPRRIMFIRHAEKPIAGANGVTKSGEQDPESLIVRGWQRAGALVQFFTSDPTRKPNFLYASGIGPHSKSNRPKETVTPLAEWLDDLIIIVDHLKDDTDGLMKSVLKQGGNVLVCWEHQLIPTLVGLLPNAPGVPQTWPDERFDIVWVLEAAGNGWKFTQIPQMLLAGDSEDFIS